MVLMGPGLENNKCRSCRVAGERLPTGSRRAESPGWLCMRLTHLIVAPLCSSITRSQQA